MQSLPPIYLKKNEDRRIRGGHLWVFSNEIDVVKSPFSQLPAGQWVELYSQSQQFIGIGYLNPASLIAIRLLHINKDQSLQDWLTQRLQSALALRTRLFRQPYYRLVYGESDSMPGVVVDRYGDYLVVQINTAGMEAMQEPLLDALMALLQPKGILLRNDSGARTQEGLETYVRVGRGDVPEETIIEEEGVFYQVPLMTGQKTGWFYDQRWNRRSLGDYVSGGSVLDVFSYIGGWGVKAAVAGASNVVCVDSSAQALSYVTANAALNKVQDRVQTRQGDAFDVLKQLHEEKKTFDLIVVDPPAFVKRKKDFKSGVKAYHHINQLAMQLAKPDAIFISCSCSWHLPSGELEEICWQAARQTGLHMQILQSGGQGPDHPVHPAIPETQYLKVVVARLSRL